MRRGLRSTSALAAIAIGAWLFLACGPEGGISPAARQAEKILASDRIYAVDDLKAAGLKVMHQYDVSGLPDAVAAIHGAFNKVEYEARFYASHADAVAHGVGPATEVSGPNAVVTGPGVKWEEGASHRRMCSRAAETPHSGCSYSARYGDFVVRGNIVLLCEGPTADQALLACNELLKDVP